MRVSQLGSSSSSGFQLHCLKSSKTLVHIASRMEDNIAIAEKGKKRLITEKRRQQGRDAQKKYSEPAFKARFGCNQSNSFTGEKQKAMKASGVAKAREMVLTCRCKPADVPAGEPINGVLQPVMQDEIPGMSDFLGADLDYQSLASSASPDDMGAIQPLEPNIEALISSMFGLPQPGSVSQSELPNTSNMMSPSIPMDSYVRVRRYSFHAACIENAFVLGITFDQIKDHKCGNDRLVSPWSNQFLNTTGNTTATAPDLSPGESQQRHDHDLYIDCLPFKDFRGKLLALRSVEPKIFDEQDFIKDLDYRDAMQCWGPTPWENRSWEIQPWFLKKWWMITGGDTGEMALSSRWWRMFRGEIA
jgi:hypothetical protein